MKQVDNVINQEVGDDRNKVVTQICDIPLATPPITRWQAARLQLGGADRRWK